MRKGARIYTAVLKKLHLPRPYTQTPFMVNVIIVDTIRYALNHLGTQTHTIEKTLLDITNF